MPNHPNRGQRTAASTPTAKEVERFRTSNNLTPGQLAEMIHVNARAVNRWELGSEYEAGRQMHPAFMELAQIKVRLRQLGMSVDQLLDLLDSGDLRSMIGLGSRE